MLREEAVTTGSRWVGSSNHTANGKALGGSDLLDGRVKRRVRPEWGNEEIDDPVSEGCA